MRKVLVLSLIGAAIVLGACSKRREAPTAPPPPGATSSTAVIRMVGTSFVPHDTTVSHADTVLWVNSSGVNHTSTSGPCLPCTADGLWNSGTMVPGDSFRVVFGPGVDIPGSIVHIDASGAFPYYCIPHAFVPMDGSITVTP